jgi:predicted dehydrogenase
MKILIAGLGSIGRRHLHNLQALGGNEISLYRTGRSTLPEAELIGLPVETDLRAALAQHPQAVVVSNPTALHLEVAIPAAEAGCHLLLEKPVSHSLERLDELKDAVQRGGGQVLVGYHFRHHPGLQKAASLIASGAIGKLLSARAHWGEYLPGWHPWEDYRQSYSARPDLGGGVILTLSHSLDYLRWLLGEVSAVWAFTGQLNDLDLQVEDTAEIGLQFSSGVLGSVHLDYNQRPSAHTLDIIGSCGSLHWDNATGGVSLFQANAEKRTLVDPSDWKNFPAPRGFERNQLFLDEMRHFLAVARGEMAPLCTLQDGVQALRVALAAHQSARERKLVEL